MKGVEILTQKTVDAIWYEVAQHQDAAGTVAIYDHGNSTLTCVSFDKSSGQTAVTEWMLTGPMTQEDAARLAGMKCSRLAVVGSNVVSMSKH